MRFCSIGSIAFLSSILQIILCDDGGGCYFPESETRPFFYEISTDIPVGTVITDSIVDPPDAQLSIASVRSSNLQKFNFRDRLEVGQSSNGMFRLKTKSSLSLPAYPSNITETFLYVTIICNGKAYPLITMHLNSTNDVRPQFYGEPYVVEVEENFGVGSIVDLPVVAIDWDPSDNYNLTFSVRGNPSFELMTTEDSILPNSIEDKEMWTEKQKPKKLKLINVKEMELPTTIRIVASDNSAPPKSSTTRVKIIKKQKKSQPEAAKAFAVKTKDDVEVVDLSAHESSQSTEAPESHNESTLDTQEEEATVINSESTTNTPVTEKHSHNEDTTNEPTSTPNEPIITIKSPAKNTVDASASVIGESTDTTEAPNSNTTDAPTRTLNASSSTTDAPTKSTIDASASVTEASIDTTEAQKSSTVNTPTSTTLAPEVSPVLQTASPLPAFDKCYSGVRIMENSPVGTEISKLTVLNRAEDTVTTLIDPDGTFTMNEDGVVSIANNKLVDRERFSTLEVLVEIKNTTKMSVCGRARIRVELEDENDNRPVFEKEKYWFHLSEEAPIGTEFATIKARDIDEHENGRITYSLLTPETPFRMSTRGRDAVLLTTKPIGSEEVYNLMVEARDHGCPSIASEVPVDVFILRSKLGKPVEVEKLKKPAPELRGVVLATIDPPLPLNDVNTEEFAATDETTTTEEITSTHRPTKRPRTRPTTQKTTTEREVEMEHVTEEVQSTTEPATDSESTTDHQSEELLTPEEFETSPFGFTAAHYYYEVFGDPLEDDVIGRVVAEPNAQMYGVDRKAAGLFKVDADIGEITVGRKLYQRTAAGNITFDVSATNGMSTARTVVTVLFDPSRARTDGIPHFDQSLYKFRIQENTSPEVIGIVRAFHGSVTARSNNQLKYDIMTEEGSLPFSIHELSGELATERELDREMKANYEFKVRSCLSENQCGIASVLVTVEDLNDNAPHFTTATQHVTLPSDLPSGSEVIRVRALDADEGSNGEVSYSITPPSTTFAIDMDTGMIITIGSLSESRYSLLIEAFDHGSPKQSDIMEVRINVQGTNPSAPVFDKSLYNIIANGPVRAGQTIAELHATDPDPGKEGKVNYQFEATNDKRIEEFQSFFEINRNTGVVSVVRPLTSLDGPFDFIVEATDESSVFKRKASSRLHIEINGGNSLQFLPLPVTIYISTEKAVGSAILRASATTTSAAPVHFRILEDDAQFIMDGDLLRVAGHLFSGSTHLTIRAETDEVHADHQITVVVMADRDKYPVFPQLTYDLDIPRESHFPLTIHRFDAKVLNGSLEYEFFPPGRIPKGLLLDEITGELTVTSDFAANFLSHDTIFIVIRAVNTAFQKFYSDVGVALSIVSQESRIRFPQQFYRFEVAENTPIGMPVGTPVEVFPKESSVTYSIVPDSQFAISNNGSLFVKTPLDLETLPVDANGNLNFVVTASFNGRRSSTKLQIQIEDVNEFVPIIDNPNVVGRISEEATPGTTIVKIQAHDPDFTEGKHLLYKIVGGSGRDFVFIQEDGTLILGENPIDKEKMDSFDVKVEVYDSVGNKASATILVEIEDANDNAPRILEGPLVWNVTEGDGTAVFPFKFEDIDSGENGNVKLRIVQGNSDGFFKINKDSDKTAHISLSQPLDYEFTSNYLLTLELRDSGSPSQFNVVPLTINVENINDNIPVFKQKEYKQKAPIDLPIGFTILTVTAADKDGDNLEYSLQGKDCELLKIDSAGAVSFTFPVMKRTLAIIKCSCEVSDGIHKEYTTVEVEVYEATQPTVTSGNRAPAFKESSYDFAIFSGNDPMVGRVLAVDPDGDQVLYSIKPAKYSNLFDVDADGKITLKVPLSELTQSVYSFEVQSEDWGPPAKSVSVNVNVHVPTDLSSQTPDLQVLNTHTSIEPTMSTSSTQTTEVSSEESNDTPKDIPIEQEHIGPDVETTNIPVIKFIRRNYMYSIRQDAPVDTYLGEAQLNYKKDVSLRLERTDRFSIDEKGRIRTAVVFNQAERTNASVVAYYRGKEVARVPFIVHVIDTQPSTVSPSTREPATVTQTARTQTTNRPTVTHTASTESTVAETMPTQSSSVTETGFRFTKDMYFGFVPEGKYSQGIRLPLKPEELSVSGANGRVSYEIADKTQSMPFFLTAEGQLVVFDVDREDRSNYMIEILARQLPSGDIARSHINVTILDVNDNYPEFESHPEVLGVLRDLSLGSSLYQFKATDADAEQSGRVQYSIEGEGAKYLSIDPVDGTLTVSKTLPSALLELSLNVTARDMGRPSLRTHHRLSLRLFDSHSPAPLLLPIQETISLLANAPKGTNIVTAIAGPNVGLPTGHESIMYTLVDRYNQLFEISNNGQISLSRELLDIEQGRIYQLNVTASNSLGTDSTLINVLLGPEKTTTVTPQNPPPSGCTFSSQVYHADVKENQLKKVLIAWLRTDCPHATYELQSDYDEFEIDSQSGELYAVKPLDRERKNLYLLYITMKTNERSKRQDAVIEYGKSKLLANQALVVVHVMDENDNAPEFVHLTDGKMISNVDWQTKVGTPVMRLQAKDADEQAELIYALSGPDSDFFSVNYTSGLVSLARSIKEHSKQEFQLIATVSDGMHIIEIPVTVYKLSPSTNIIRLTSELSHEQVKEYQIERMLNDILDSNTKVLAKQEYADENGGVQSNRSHIFVYSVDKATKQPLNKEKLISLLEPHSAELLASPARISSVSMLATDASSISTSQLVTLLVVLIILLLILFCCCYCAVAVRRKRYASNIDQEFMVGGLGNPRPYDVKQVSRQTAQTVLAGRSLPDPMTTRVDSAMSPSFMEGSISTNRSDTMRDFANSVRERPSLLQSALAKQKVRDGSLSATVDIIDGRK